MLGYVTMGTNDVPRARAFYGNLLSDIGMRKIMEFAEDRGGFTLYAGGMDQLGIAVTLPYNQEPATVGNGNMTAISLKDRAQVDAFHAKALELGGSCEGPPGVRGDEGPQAFYGAYFRDPAGNKLCAYRIGPA